MTGFKTLISLCSLYLCLYFYVNARTPPKLQPREAVVRKRAWFNNQATAKIDPSRFPRHGYERRRTWRQRWFRDGHFNYYEPGNSYDSNGDYDYYTGTGADTGDYDYYNYADRPKPVPTPPNYNNNNLPMPSPPMPAPPSNNKVTLLMPSPPNSGQIIVDGGKSPVPNLPSGTQIINGIDLSQLNGSMAGQQVMVKVPPFCLKGVSGRGVGRPIHSCSAKAGYEQSGLLCYPECKAGYRGVGPVCWEDCKETYGDTGVFCGRDVKIISSDNGDCPWYDICGLTFSRGCSSCPEVEKPLPPYKNDGCTCRRDVHVYAKDSYGRGFGVPLGCSVDEDWDAALCYDKCPKGMDGIGPLCWQNTCPSILPAHFGPLCCLSKGACLAQGATLVLSKLKESTGMGMIEKLLGKGGGGGGMMGGLGGLVGGGGGAGGMMGGIGGMIG